MLKLAIFLGSVLLVQSATAFAGGLYFGASTALAKQNSFCYFRATVPQVLPAPGSDARLNAVAQKLNAAWIAQQAKIATDYQDAIKDPDQCKEFSTSYQESLNFQIMTDLDAKITSIQSTEYAYTGGAHGSTGIAGQTFNSATGEGYASLADFYPETTLPKLKAKLDESLKTSVEGFDPTFGWDDIKAKMTSMSAVTNFYLTPNGINIYFNQYEVAPYASGIINIMLYWDDVKALGLKTTGPATLLEMAEESP